VDRRWHAPRAFAVLLALIGVAAFVWLGRWQLHRAAEKEQLFAAYAGATEQKPVTLEAARRMGGDATRYPLVSVRGRYDTTHTYVLDDQPREGAVGSIAYAIFEPADGSTAILVDRGFVAGKTRGEPPPIPPPPADEQQITALYAPAPGSGLHLGGNALPRQTAWPKRSIYLDVNDVAADAGRSLDPRVLKLAPEPGSGFVRVWRPDVFPPERHRGYAFTWFTLAAVVVAAFVVMHWRKETK
jgi:cytochrome oxidase assembly protein ShyY1